MPSESKSRKLNVLGEPLKSCCCSPMTGFFRDGLCRTDEQDIGRHVVCAQMTEEFLTFSQTQGNDLITPRPEWQFPGLKPGDLWCLCALRWKEAFAYQIAPPVVLASTEISALNVIPLEALKAYAIDKHSS